MKINRRDALKQFLVISAGAALVPSCLQKKERTSAHFKNIPLNEDDAALLTQLTETIIPSGKTPGAKEVSVDLFVFKMVDDCLSKKDQEKFISGMKKFYSWVEQRNGKSFIDCSEAEREAILQELENKKVEDEEITFFYRTAKRFTMRGYTSSEYYLTQVQGYKIIPGQFKGCVPVTKA